MGLDLRKGTKRTSVYAVEMDEFSRAGSRKWAPICRLLSLLYTRTLQLQEERNQMVQFNSGNCDSTGL